MDRPSLCLLLESSKNGGSIVKSKDKKILAKLIAKISNRHDSLHGPIFVPVPYSHQYLKYKMKGNENKHIPFEQLFSRGAWRASKPEVCGRVHPDNASAPTLQV